LALRAGPLDPAHHRSARWHRGGSLRSRSYGWSTRCGAWPQRRTRR